eukprot:tig00020911_g15746.t1
MQAFLAPLCVPGRAPVQPNGQPQAESSAAGERRALPQAERRQFFSGRTFRPAPAERTARAASFCPSILAEMQQEEQRGGFFGRLVEGLSKTRSNMMTRIEDVIDRNMGKYDEGTNTLDEIEEVLVTSDLGLRTTLAIMDDLRAESGKKILKGADIKLSIKGSLAKILKEKGGKTELNLPTDKKPAVIMVVGVNGAGKTTTIGKLAHKFVSEGKKVLLAAGDTFRAAADEQLEVWAGRVGADIVAIPSAKKPAQVLFAAVEKALADGTYDVLIADTAGRLHTNFELMEELSKMKQTLAMKIPGAPHEVLMVIDGTTGQNALSQAKEFKEVAGSTGIIVTKLDGTAKGGVVVSVVQQTGIPVKFIGVGERMEDLQAFDPDAFVEALFAE